MIDITQLSAKSEYDKLTSNRSSFLDRAKLASTLTLPQLYPDSEETSSTTYPTPYQSLGARGVNNLANKIVLSLFPPATAFFRLDANQATKESNGVTDGDMAEAMQIVEKAIVDEMETSQLRSKLVEGAKLGIVGGSHILYVPDDGNPSIFNMAQFGIKRSKSGSVIKMVIREKVNYLELDPDIQNSLQDLEETELDGTKEMDMYRMIVLGDKNMYHVIQECKGVKLAGTDGTYKMNELPYIFVPFVDRGEDYGRSYVEDYIGDLQSYEGLRKAVLDASAESARLIYLMRPNSVLTPKKLASAASGDVLAGNPDDVTTLQADKRMDVQMAQKESDILRQDLGTIFLLDSAVRRDAERVKLTTYSCGSL